VTQLPPNPVSDVSARRPVATIGICVGIGIGEKSNLGTSVTHTKVYTRIGSIAALYYYSFRSDLAKNFHVVLPVTMRGYNYNCIFAGLYAL